jgi:signal transduction histidine kinase
MVNLLSNAMKFSPVNSKIVVSLLQIVEGSVLKSCEISVKDEGIGISVEE